MHDARFTPDLVNLLFKFRTRMFHVRNNFRNKYKQTNTLCPLCQVNEDSQSHLFECTAIQKQLQKNTSILYDDIFSSDNETLLKVGKELKKIVAVRQELEDVIVPED